MRAFFARIWAWIKKVLHIGSRNETPSEAVGYYGCPNSSKAKKLQLSKNLYK